MPMAVQRRTAYKLFDNGVVLPEGGWETPFLVFAFLHFSRRSLGSKRTGFLRPIN